MPVVFKRPIGPVVSTITADQWLALPKSKRPSTVAFWKGEGLDGAPIVAILTGLVLKSSNRKTGEMAQSYIVRQDMSPMDASRLGLDVSVCGTCDLRKNLVAKILAETGERKAKCYVNVGWLTKMWTGWYTGQVVWMDPVEVGKLLAYLSLPLRQGAYGDPCRGTTERMGRYGYRQRYFVFPSVEIDRHQEIRYGISEESEGGTRGTI